MSIYLTPVNTSVTIASQKVNPINLVLTQEYGDHHHFEITLDYDMYGDDFMSDPIKHIELIGEQVVMNFSHKNDNSDYYQFTGVVTNIKQTGREGKKGYLVVSGSSPTIMLEKGKRMDVYSNKTLIGIFEILLESVHSNYMKHVANPIYKNRVDFLMQYNETDWDFLKRIAYLYKENLFYSGVEILFGKYEEWDPVKLSYDKEVTDLEFCSRMLPNNVEYYQYVADRDETIERTSPERIENSNDYLDTAEQQNIILTNKKPAKSYIDAPTYDSTDISDMLKREKSRNAAQTISIKGKSKTYKNTIGRLINISMPSLLSKTSNIGTYRVVKSVHRIDEKNRYSCEFEAVPASLDTMPVKEPKMPQADSVIGKIRSNEDPLNQGRVQVDFDFASNYNFYWLRVLTPNAGSSAEVPQNRGMVFVPEKGDQVMIGFEYGDPNRPYVMGSLFHGKNGHGGGENNAEKSIITKRGIRIVFNDNQRSLHIEDPSGNTWDMDGNGNIDISAPKRVRIKASDLEVDIQNNITFSAGNQMTSNIAKRIITNTHTLNQSVVGVTSSSSGNFFVKVREQIKMESLELYTIGQNKLFAHSDQSVVINSKGNTEIKGDQGSNFTNIAEDVVASTDLDAKAVVNFLPHDGWQGEFGFDWMRIGKGIAMGMSGTSLDVDYKPLLGYYENNSTAYAFVADTDTNNDGVNDRYAKLKLEYTPMRIIHKRDASNNPLEYFVPILRIYKHPRDLANYKSEAHFKIQIEVLSEPDELYLEYNSDYFEIRDALAVVPITDAATETTSVTTSTRTSVLDKYMINQKTVNTSNTPHVVDIVVVCKQNFDIEQEIRAIVAKKDPATNDTVCSLAGLMKIKPNDATHRKVRKMVLVNVIKNEQDGLSIEKRSEHAKTLRKLLRQAYVDPIIESENLNLDILSAETIRELNAKFPADSDGKILCYDDSTTPISEDISMCLTKFLPIEYQNFDILRIFYMPFGIKGKSQSGTILELNGYSNGGSHNIVMAFDTPSSTIAHEVLHDLHLTHIFVSDDIGAGQTGVPNGKHSYKKGTTCNIMDYTSMPRYFIYEWQAQIVNNAATSEPTDYEPKNYEQTE